MAAKASLAVVLEHGHKKVFAVARDWPGWSRSGKSDDEAVAALLAYAPRYARVVKAAGIKRSLPSADATPKIVQRLEGGSGTDFGVPGVSSREDTEPLTGAELKRQQAILEASWKAFDAMARKAKGKTLTVGPRGGGRTLAKMTAHLLDAEIAYLGQLGSRHAKPEQNHDEIAQVRREALAALRARTAGRRLPNPRNTKRPWTPRYFIRRSAWHSLDHAWELEDRIAD